MQNEATPTPAGSPLGVEPTPQQPSVSGPAQDKPTTNTKMKWGLLLAALIIVVGGVTAYMLTRPDPKPAVQKRTVKIGLLAPLAGDNVSVGLSMRQAVQLAIKDLNQEGTTIELVERDSGCQAEQSKAAAEELILKEKVVAIVGDNCSGATLASSVVANANKVVMVSPASTSPLITTDGGDYVFRTIPSDALQGVFTADLMYKAGAKRLAILYSDEAYGQGLSAVAKTQFEKNGGTVVANVGVDRESVDVTAAMNQIKAAKPDTLYIVSGAAAQNAAALLAAQKAGLQVKLYGAEGFTDKTILSDAATAAEGLIVTTVAEGSSSFAAKYQAAYQAAPSVYTAQAYDAFAAIGAALKTGANTGEEIKNALYKVDFQGASGHIQFDKNGDPVEASYSVYTVKNGQLELTPQ